MSSRSSRRPERETISLTTIAGETLELDLAPAGEPIVDDRVRGELRFAGRLWNAVAAGRLRLPRELDALTVADFHLVRDVAERRGVIATEPSVERCRNCDALLTVDRTNASLETLLAADPSDAPPEGPFELPRAVAGVRTIVQRPVTVKIALPLFRFVADSKLPLDGRVVRALGVKRLELARRRLVDPERIADALADDDALFALVETLYVELNYPPRLRIPAFCPSCRTIHDVPTPSVREVVEDPDALDLLDGIERDASASFPSFEDFEARVFAIGAEVYAARRVANIELLVIDDVPPVDDGGEPLMGSYEPVHEDDGAGFTRVRFVISLYYRTFASMWADAPYDVEAEIRETIDHEIEHHLHHLAGHDPLDEEERREARRDLERTFGPETVRRAEREALRAELRSIARFAVVGALICGALLAGAIALGLVE